MWLYGWMSLALAAPIDLDDAIRTARSRAPDFVSVEAEREAAVGASLSTRAVQNPWAEIEQLPHETEARLSVWVPVGGAPFAWGKSADAAVDAADARREQARGLASADVALAYLDAVRAEARAELAELALADARSAVDAIARLEAQGEIAAVDRAMAQAMAAEAFAQAASARQQAATARLRLEASMGLPPTGTTETAGWPDLPLPPALDPAQLPWVRAESDEARAARAARVATALGQVPPIQVTVGRSWPREDTGHPGTIVGAGLTVPLLAPGVGATRQARAQAEQATAEADRARLDAEAAVQSAKLEADAAEQAWTVFASVTGLEDAMRDIATALTVGEYAVLDYTQRRQTLLAAMASRIDARFRLEVARLELWRLSGRLPGDS